MKTNPVKFGNAMWVLIQHRDEMDREEISAIRGYIMALMDNVTLQSFDRHVAVPTLDLLQMVYDKIHDDLADLAQSCNIYDETEAHIASDLSRAAARLEARVAEWADVYACEA